MLARLDSRLLYLMRTRFHQPVPEAIMRLLGRVGEYGAIWVAIGVVAALLAEHDRGEWLAAGLLGPVAIGLNFAVKLLVRRSRPELEGLPPLGGAPTSLSFPSAHATSSFAVATAMTRIDPSVCPLFALAALLALGRAYLGMHYPSDALAGALLGTALGFAFPLGAF